MKYRAALSFLLVMALMAGAVQATAAAGITSTLLGKGTTTGAIAEQFSYWEHGHAHQHFDFMLLTNRRGDVAYTDLTFAPGAYTGWHSHPGFVVVTVVEGSLDAYDKHCQLQKFTAGQSFTEGAGHVHDVLNQGTANARVLALYITKQGSPRRLDVDQPPCAVGAGLP